MEKIIADMMLGWKVVVSILIFFVVGIRIEDWLIARREIKWKKKS